MNVTSRISKVIRTLGIMGIMLALAGIMAGTTAQSASANSRLSQGKLNVLTSVSNTASNVLAIEVAVSNEQGVLVSKGYAASDGSYGIKLAPGIYKVQVNAPGFKSYSEIVKIVANGTTTIKATLEEDR